jgi:hypothetical protein
MRILVWFLLVLVQHLFSFEHISFLSVYVPVVQVVKNGVENLTLPNTFFLSSPYKLCT